MQKILPDKIREARGELSQGVLAFAISNIIISSIDPCAGPISAQTVSAWERGVCLPGRDNFDGLCRATGKSADFFYGDEVDGSTTNQHGKAA